MKLKDIMPFTNEQKQIEKSRRAIASNSETKNGQNSTVPTSSKELLSTYNKIIISGYKMLKENELDLLQLIIFRIENDSSYCPSPSIIDFAKRMFQTLDSNKSA